MKARIEKGTETMRAWLLGSVSACVALALAAPAAAQDTAQQESEASSAGQVADIVVTAQRREESVQDVPIAISAFSGAELQSRGVTNTLQLGVFVPNLVAQNNTGIGSANAYFLRGLGSTETIATFDPPVGTYVDDIYLSRQNANNLAFFDVDRVEVLRGPQGTLFGRNTTGGAINVIMKQPDFDRLSGYGEIGYGRFNKVFARASVNAPVSEGFALKISGYFQDDDGYVKNVTTGDRLNDDDGWGFRLGARAEFSPAIRWNGSYMHIVSNGENILNFECNPAAPTQCKGRFATTGLREGELSASPYLPFAVVGAKGRFPLGQESSTDIVTSNLQFDIAENTTISFITGYVALSQQFALDFFDGRGGPNIATPRPAVRGYTRGGFVIANDGDHKQFTQEVKLNGSFGDGLIDYVAGVFYINERNRTDFADVFTLSPATSLILADRILRNKTESIAGYVQADLNITDQLKLTAGVRYTDEEKTLNVTDNRATCAAATLPATCLDNRNLVSANGVRIPTKQNVKLWTPRFAVNYRPNDDLLFFASATRGFKSGGWNARATAPSQLLPFAPEKVWSYEAGIKSDLFDRRVRANITAFWLDVSDLQVLGGLQNPATGALTFLTRNFADYRNKGVEAEFTFVPVDNLNLYLNVGYQDDNYRVPRNAPATDAYGIPSVAAQQAACLAQRALNQVPGAPNTAPAGQPVNNAPACGNGIVTATGGIATPVRTPTWSVAVGGSYKFELGQGGWSITPNVNAAYRSKQEVAIANLSFYDGTVTGSNGSFPANPFGNGRFITGSQSAANWIVNASVLLSAPDDKWQFTAECQNCLNESFIQSALSNYSYLNPPMTWMVRARYNF